MGNYNRQYKLYYLISFRRTTLHYYNCKLTENICNTSNKYYNYYYFIIYIYK